MPGKNVLIVEDTPQVRKGLERQLEIAGHRVSSVASGEEALDQIARTIPDVVILDIGLPGMNGWEVLKRLREDSRTAALPVVVLTGADGTAEMIRGYGLGACYYVTKPHDREELLRGLELFAS